jgi:hypothetical protein
MLAYRRVAPQRSSPTLDAIKQRDAVISFECVAGVVKVIETAAGKDIQSRTTLKEFDVVAELEEKYIFFAGEAEIARKLIQHGRSCVLSVYFREP